MALRIFLRKKWYFESVEDIYLFFRDCFVPIYRDSQWQIWDYGNFRWDRCL